MKCLNMPAMREIMLFRIRSAAPGHRKRPPQELQSHTSRIQSTKDASSVNPLCGSKRELCTRCCWPHNGLGAPRARPPERSGDRGAPRATAKGVRGGEAPRIWVGAPGRLMRSCARGLTLMTHDPELVTQKPAFFSGLKVPLQDRTNRP